MIRDGRARSSAPGAVILKNDYTGRCMDDNFTCGLRTISCNGDGCQAWYVLFNYGDELQD